MIKIGHSFDIHRLEEGHKLFLGGINIPFEKGLVGHSDADCLLHAISEAIIGALGKGDLGTFFPDTDMKYEGIASSYFVNETVKMMENEGYHLNNLDATIYLEKPHMNIYMKELKENIAFLLKTNIDCINIKATRYEKLDSIGEGKAIASEVVVLIEK